MKKLIGVITNNLRRSNTIKTRFFYIDTGKIREVTKNLCDAIKLFNDRSAENENGYTFKIPYEYKKGTANYTFGCGLTHYLHTDEFNKIYEVARDILNFNLIECDGIDIFTHSDMKHILEVNDAWDGRIEEAIINYYN